MSPLINNLFTDKSNPVFTSAELLCCSCDRALAETEKRALVSAYARERQDDGRELEE